MEPGRNHFSVVRGPRSRIVIKALWMLVLASVVGHAQVTIDGGQRRVAPLGIQSSDSVLVFGPKKYSRSSGFGFTIHEDDFSTTVVPGRRYVLEVDNSGITYFRFSNNSQEWVGSGELSGRLFREIDVGANNDMTITLGGSPGNSVSLRVVHVKEPTYYVHGRADYDTSDTDTVFFSIPSDASTPHTVHVINGNGAGANRVDQGSVELNGSRFSATRISRPMWPR